MIRTRLVAVLIAAAGVAACGSAPTPEGSGEDGQVEEAAEDGALPPEEPAADDADAMPAAEPGGEEADGMAPEGGGGLEVPDPDFTLPEDGFVWWLEPRFVADGSNWRPYGVGAPEEWETYDPKYVHGDHLINVDGCATAEDSDAPPAEVGPSGLRYTWEVAHQGTVVGSGIGCRTALSVDTQGVYDVTLHVSESSGATTPVSQVVAVRDYLIVAIGDSYGSGEGAPNRVRGAAARAEWSDNRCHRSMHSGSAQFAEQLEKSDPYTTVTYLSFACSGATVNRFVFEPREATKPFTMNPSLPLGSGILGPYCGVDPPPNTCEQRPHPSEPHPYRVQLGLIPPQIDQLAAAITSNGDGGPVGQQRTVDVLLISGGGNDMGFAPVLTGCVLEWECWGKRFDAPKGPKTLQELVDEGIAGLADSFAALNESLALLPISRIAITEYPDPTTGEGGVTCEILEDLGLPVPTLTIVPEEAVWARDSVLAPLNAALEAAAAQHGWEYVSGISAAAAGHGYCAKTGRWFVRAEESERQQGPPGERSKSTGTMHPNEAGYANYAVNIEAALAPVIQELAAPPADGGYLPCGASCDQPWTPPDPEDVPTEEEVDEDLFLDVCEAGECKWGGTRIR